MPWYQGFFDEDYVAYHLRGDTARAERTQAECDAVVNALQPAPGAKILDVPCGQGRHAIELARRGYQMTGADLSEHLLGLARKAAAEAQAQVRFEHCDMRELPWENEFDYLINLWTSFGYLETDEENEAVLGNLCRALKPGGKLVLDLPNRDEFVKAPAQGHKDWYEHDGRLVLELHTWTAAGKLRLDRTIIEPDGARRNKWFELRIYTHPEIIAMLHRAGLEWEKTYGDLQGTEFAPTHRRMFVVAIKPN